MFTSGRSARDDQIIRELVRDLMDAHGHMGAGARRVFGCISCTWLNLS